VSPESNYGSNDRIGVLFHAVDIEEMTGEASWPKIGHGGQSWAPRWALCRLILGAVEFYDVLVQHIYFALQTRRNLRRPESDDTGPNRWPRMTRLTVFMQSRCLYYSQIQYDTLACKIFLGANASTFKT
jgi:hypothetical protein